MNSFSSHSCWFPKLHRRQVAVVKRMNGASTSTCSRERIVGTQQCKGQSGRREGKRGDDKEREGGRREGKKVTERGAREETDRDRQ